MLLAHWRQFGWCNGKVIKGTLFSLWPPEEVEQLGSATSFWVFHLPTPEGLREERESVLVCYVSHRPAKLAATHVRPTESHANFFGVWTLNILRNLMLSHSVTKQMCNFNASLSHAMMGWVYSNFLLARPSLDILFCHSKILGDTWQAWTRVFLPSLPLGWVLGTTF